MIKIDKEFTHNLNESLSCTNWYAWTYNFLYHHCYQMKKALLGNVMVNHSSFIFTHFSRSSQYFLSYSFNYIKKKKKKKSFIFVFFQFFRGAEEPLVYPINQQSCDSPDFSMYSYQIWMVRAFNNFEKRWHSIIESHSKCLPRTVKPVFK